MELSSGLIDNCNEIVKMLEITLFSCQTNEIQELRSTVQTTKQLLSNFIFFYPKTFGFQHMIEHLKQLLGDFLKMFQKLLKLNRIFDEWKIVDKISLFKLDYTLKLHVDQIHSLFVLHKDYNACSTLTDTQCQIFWERNIGANKKILPMNDFIDALTKVYTFTNTKKNAFEKFIDFTGDGYMTCYKFGKFIHLFGPFDEQCFERFFLPHEKQLISGFIPAIEATYNLKDKPPNTYIVRISKSNPSNFAITFKDNDEEIKHVLLYSIIPGGGLTLQQPPTTYPSLHCFISNNTYKLKYPCEILLANKKSQIDTPLNYIAFDTLSTSKNVISKNDVFDISNFFSLTLPNNLHNHNDISQRFSINIHGGGITNNINSSNLNNTILCSVCSLKPCDSLIDPCKHFFSCNECLVNFVNCPFCLIPISKKI